MNVGLPRNVAWRGRTVYTGVWKAPVGGPAMARRLNIDGDGQGDLGGHGGEQRAVFVYQLDSYRYWQRVLGRDDFGYGQFGENFTVEGLPDDEVCIGDRYRIGAALFEVTQPRVTCYRVGIRMDDPRIPALLVQHHRPGLLPPGARGGPGPRRATTSSRWPTDPERMTVAEVDGLLYLPGHPRATDRAGACASRRSAPAGRRRSEAMLDERGSAPATPVWSPSRHRRRGPGSARCGSPRSSRRAATIASVRLADPDGGPVPAALPGQFLTVRLRPDPAGPPVLRSYSLSGRPGDDEYRISVKREPHGVGQRLPATRACGPAT